MQAADEAADSAVAEQSRVDEGDESNFAEEQAGNSTEDSVSEASSGSDGEEDFIRNAADEAEKAAAANQVVDPTLAPDPALAAESAQGFDPTALADNPSEAIPANDPNLANDAAAAEAAATAALDGGSDVNPVGVGSDLQPPAFDGSVANNMAAVNSGEPLPPAGPAPAAPTVPAPPAAPARDLAARSPAEESADGHADPQEIDPAFAQLRWVGYRIDEKERRLKVEVITRGQPEFEIFEETNRAQQLELVIRFYQTQLRRKIRWSINSSEFRSPVALVRMREFQDRGVVDLILTHRDPVLPDFVAQEGQMQLAYAIPDRYFDQSKAEARVVKEKAESLLASNATPLAPSALAARGRSKQVGYQAPGLEIQARTPIRDYMRQQPRQVIDGQGLPASFEKRKSRQAGQSSWQIERFGLLAVAQDDGGQAALEGEEEADAVPEDEGAGDETLEVSQNENAAALSDEIPGQSDEDAAAAAAEAEAIPVETVDEGNVSSNGESSVNVAPEAANPAEAAPAPAAAPAGNAAATPPPPFEAASAPAASPEPAAMMAPEPEAPPLEQAPEVMGQSAPSGERQSFSGKTIFMEFYEAPLSVVLKGFSEETGNNFVYPAAIGQTPVTVTFKGVPWDEALKAILETYSLGMVRIGENVVRIDQITNLSNYLQALEQARQFETRRLPTKVLVFRLNNAKAKDVAERINNLLTRDVQLDNRIRVSNDDRTNSLVIEAPTHVLAKAKNIIERLDLETPQVEIASRIVEVQKSQNNFFGVSWLNALNFDPGRALGFGTLNFPNSLGSSFAVDPGVSSASTAGQGRFRFGSLNKFLDLDLLLKMEEKKGTTNVLQSNRVLVLDGQKAMILAGSSRFFRPAAGGNVINPTGGGASAGQSNGLAEVTFNLSLEVTPQVTALGSVIMNLNIKSDTPGDVTGETLANKNTRELETQMVRSNGDTGVIGGIYDTTRINRVTGIPFLSDIPIIGALFRSNTFEEKQTELLIMVTPTIISGMSKEAESAAEASAAGLPPPTQALGPIQRNRAQF